jgi:membrane associated rhomboid family serine protease
MLYDRPYMRRPLRAREFSPLAWLIIATAAMYVVQSIFAQWLQRPMMLPQMLGLSLEGVRGWHLWTLVTYGFLHAPQQQWGLLHLTVNMVMLYLLGSEVMPQLGRRRFLGFYFGALAASGIVWLAVALGTENFGTALGPPGLVLGASGAVFATLALWALLASDEPRTFLLFLVFPLTLKPRHIALLLLGFSVFGLLFLEIPQHQPVAHSAHLGGMLAGWLYYRFLHEKGGRPAQDRPAIEMPAWLRKKKKAPEPAQYTVNVSPPGGVRAEVDRILDKINAHGFGSLTGEERRVLDEARDLLNRR